MSAARVDGNGQPWMTVGQLARELARFDADAPVVIGSSEGTRTLAEVGLRYRPAEGSHPELYPGAFIDPAAGREARG
jgi:hypothetical protein